MNNAEKSMDNANEAAVAKPGPFIPMDKKDIIRAAIYGAFAGAILTVLYILVSRVASAAMCRGDNDLCQNAPLYVAIFSVTLVSIGGLILLSQARIYRPLFVVIASVAALWGLQAYLALLPWYWAMAAMTVIGALTYAMFTWLARLRSFILYLVVSIVLIVAARLIIAG